MRILAVLLLVICGSVQAQHSLVVKDAKGKVIGIPVSLTAGVRGIDIITMDGNLLSLNQWDGSLNYANHYPLFAAPDCTGPAFSTFHHRSASPTFIAIPTNEIALLPIIPEFREVAIASSWSTEGCGNYQEPELTEVVAYSDYVIDPVAFGFELLPGLKTWGFPVPLSIEVVKSGGIFCSGFEACPQQ